MKYWEKLVISCAVMLVVFIALVPNSAVGLYILPPEEGLNVGVLGWQPSLSGTLYSNKNPPIVTAGQDGYELVSDDSHSYSFGYWHHFSEMGGLYQRFARTDARIETSQPWHEKVQDISYSIKMSDGSYRRVRGELWCYHLDVDLSTVLKNGWETGIYDFKGEQVWLALTTNHWGQALQDQGSGVMGTAYGAPISVYVEGYTVAQGSGDHVSISPSNTGRFISLYSKPSSAGTTIDDLGIDNGANINATLANDLRPDSRMSEQAYMKFTLNDFGITSTFNALGQLDKVVCPAVNYKLKVYYLSIGEWTLTKTDDENWTDRQAEEKMWGWTATFVWWADSLWKLFDMVNPLRTLGTMAGYASLLFLVLVAGIAVSLIIIPIGKLLLGDRGKKK